MNWSRIKSILIGVFILVNIYLLIQYFAVNESANVLSNKTVENTVTFLEEKDITIKEDAIPRQIEYNKKSKSSYKTGADVLVAFADVAQKKKLTPCTIKELSFDNGIWTVKTDKGDYTFNATNLEQSDTKTKPQ